MLPYFQLPFDRPESLGERGYMLATYIAFGLAEKDVLKRAGGFATGQNGPRAPASVAGLTFVAWQETIGCGGVAVLPNDVIVADGDGAVVVPAALLDEVLDAALEQERLEGWIMREVESGVPLPGLYPADEATKARYEAWRKDLSGS